MSGNAITISPLIPLTQPVESLQLAPTTVDNVRLNFAVPNNIGLITAYDPLGNQIFIQSDPVTIAKPVDVILKPNLPLIPIKDQQFMQHKPKTIFVENVPKESNNNNNKFNHVHNPENKVSDMVVYRITYPEELNLKAVKRGRTKNKAQEKHENVEEVKHPPVKAPRTRSGRIIKTPKHIEKDFEKILITNEPEVKTAKFISVEDDKQEKKDLQELERHFKKKTVSSQFRCSFCKKAYFGKRAMYQHILKNPNHGPLPDRNNNFDVWNYLVDITQKSPQGRRGAKFCEELTNLLHNLQLLTSALFKNNDSLKNTVHVDKVLGNAIGLEPGKYNFDENELYKDVTVLKLITNSHFFNPKKATPANSISSSNTNSSQTSAVRTADKDTVMSPKTESEMKCTTRDMNINLVRFQDSVLPLNTMGMVTSSGSSENNQRQTVDIKSEQLRCVASAETNGSPSKTTAFHENLEVVSTHQPCLEDDEESVRFGESISNIGDKPVTFSENLVENNDQHNCIENGNKSIDFGETVDSIVNKTIAFSQNLEMESNRFACVDKNERSGTFSGSLVNKEITFPRNLVGTNFSPHAVEESYTRKQEEPKATNVKMSQSECIDSFGKTIEDRVMTNTFKKLEESSLSLHSDLLSDNSLMAMPNLRTSVDELMLSNVDASSHLLDNSTSSDEVMNVDQFVNERFKKITEPDTDLKFNTSLNLDLPSLDLFQFHTS